MTDRPDDVTESAEDLLDDMTHVEHDPFAADRAPGGILGAVHALRLGIERFTSVTGQIAIVLTWVVFVLGLFNVVTRYIGRFVQQDIIVGQMFDLQWMTFGTLVLLGFNYGVREGVNPRIDFWWANYKARTKAWIDLVIHVFFFLPFLVLGIRVLWPYAMTGLGRSFDGSWSTWRVWEIWEQSADAGGLTRGPIKLLLVLGFVFFASQILAEIIKAVMVLIGREDLAEVAQHQAPMRVE